MGKIIALFFVMFFSTVSLETVLAQEKKSNDVDTILKDSIYNANRLKVLNFSLKEFDGLFLEFFEKQSNPKLMLTKKEFYLYTIRIAIFSDRLAALYPDQKEIAAASKKKWFAESYEDYLNFKSSPKK